jgi:autotransporter-associated beta strand protein
MKAKTALLCLIVVSLTVQANAATLTWDSNAATAPNPYDGGGTWNVTGLNWWNGTANVAWSNTTNVSDTAAFGTPPAALYQNAGGVGLGAAANIINLGGLQFNPYVAANGKYNINNGTLAFGANAATIAVNTVWSRPFAAMNVTLTGTGGITVSGSGILEWGTGANSFTGGLNMAVGSSLSIDTDARLGAAANVVNFNGDAALIVRTTNPYVHNIAIAPGVTGSLDVLNGVTATWGSATTAISGSGNLQKSGLGTLTLIGTHLYQGETRVRQGTLNLDFSNAASPAANIVNPNSSLVLGGGLLVGNGKTSAAVNTQTFNGTTLVPGASGMSLTLNTATTVTANLGAITRNPGSTVNLATIATNTFYTTSNSNTNGILGGFATVNGTDWLTVSGGSLVAYAGYAGGDPTTWTSASNVSLTADPAPALADNATINSLRVLATATVTIPVSKTLTLTSGGILISGTSPATIAGGMLKGSAAGDLIVLQNSTGSTTISSVIADNGGATALTKSGAGALVLTGPNTYTGPTYLNSGSLEATSDAGLGVGTAVIARTGTTLTFSGSSAIASTKNFLFDLGSDSFGANGLGGTATDVANFNVVVSNPAGATLSGTFKVTAGTFAKKGAGTLTLTNPAGAQLSRLNGGNSVEVLEGGLTLNGGAGALWQAGQGEFTIGAADNGTVGSTRVATVNLTSGAVVVGSWTSIGRGNGTTGLQSQLIMTGGTWDCGNFGMGFANGVAGFNAKPKLDLSNDAVMTVRDFAYFGESGGADVTVNLSGSSQMLIRNRFTLGQNAGAKATLSLSGSSVLTSATAYMSIGANGSGVVNVQDSATFGCASDFNVSDLDNSTGSLNITGGTVRGATLYVGKGSNVATTLNTWGVVNQSGGSFLQTGAASAGDWRIGGKELNDADVYGGYVISGTGILDVAGRNFQVGAYGRGVLDISGSATVTSNGGWPVVGRFAGAFGLMNLSGSGSFNQLGAGNGLLIGEAGTGTLNMSGGTLSIVGGTGLRISNGATGAGLVNLSGGTLTTPVVSMNGGAGRIYLNGGLLKAATNAATGFMAGLTQALVGPAGAKLDTNGKNITVGQSLTAPAGNGVASLTVGLGGAGYVGQPIVSITGGGGTGASATAIVTSGVVTGFVITNPGTGYTDVPVVTLVGGGTTTAATGSAALGPVAAMDGGLTKTGAGTLTLSGANTYKGGTTVNGGALALGASNVLADTGAVTITGADFDIGAFSDTVGAVTLTNGNLLGTSGNLTATSFAVSNATGTSTVSAGLSGTGVNLPKAGAGNMNLTGNNTYTGTTFISGGGTTALGAAGALDPISSLSISGSTLDLRNGVATRAQTVANLTLDNATLVVGLTGVTTDALTATGTTTASGTNTIKIVGSVTPNTYTVLVTAAPLTGTFNLDTSGVLAGFTSYTGTINGNNYEVTASGNTTPGTAYWMGDVSADWSDATQAPNNSNWATNASGLTDTKQLPSGTSHVFFAATGAGNTTTNLGADFSIYSLTFESGAASVIGGTKTLTILGANTSNFPLEVLPGASATLNATTVYTGTTNLQAGGTLTVSGGNLGAAADGIVVEGTFNVNSDVTKGILSGTGLITRSVEGTSTLTVGDASPQIFAGNLQNALGTLSFTKAGAGSLLLSGTNNSFGGTLKIAGGSLAIDNVGALLNPGAVIQQSVSAFTNGAGDLTLTCPYSFDLNGGVAVTVNQPALGGGLGNYLLDLGAGSTRLTGLISSNGGSVVKRGSGTLAITNGGANVLANSPGIAYAIQEGNLVLDGGGTSSYGVIGELAVGDNTPNQVSMTLNSGTLNVSTYLSVGRGNGATALQSTLNLNGGMLAVANLFTGYANGIGGYNARPVINLNGATANVGAVRIGESAGCFATLNLTAGALTATGVVQVGFGGTGVATNNIPISVGSLQVGAATGAGAFYNNSTLTVTSGAAVGHFPIGNGVGGYGYFRNNEGGTVVIQEVGIAGSGGGAGTGGVLDVIGGAVTVNAWLTPNRGAAGESCLLNVTGGTFTTPNSGQAGANWSTNQYAHLDVSGTGSIIGGGAAAALNLNQTSSADNTGMLTIGTGGTVQLTSILMAATAGNTVINFNGGTLKAGAAAPALIAASITGAYLHGGGGIIDTNTFDATIGEPLLAPTGSGVATIPLATTGAGYVGRPIVRIAGDGVGATAIADFDPATGEVSGITVTSPGSGYTTPPTVTLVGGGGTTPAVVGAVTLAAATTTGGLTKIGDGTLTLAALNTYTGNTAVNGGTLNLADNAQLKFVIGANGVNNSIGGTGTLTLDGDFVIDTAGADLTLGNSWPLVNVGTLTETFGATFTVVGFNESSNVWTKSEGGNIWTFTEATGTLTFSVGTPYSLWATAKGLTAGVNDGKTQDPDNDGRTNFQEYAFDGDPLSGANDGKIVGKIATVAGSNVLTLTLPVRAGAVFSDDPTTHEEVSAPIDGVIYHIQGGSDLAAWTDNVTEVTGADATAIQSGLPTPLSGGWTYRTFRVAGTVSGTPADFIRAKVTE